MNRQTYEHVQILWDYMVLNQKIENADCIVGFGCYNEDVARRAAQLYLDGYAPRILFTGTLGRNTKNMWCESEAERFARIAISEGVPEKDIILEQRAANSGENLIFSRQLLMDAGFSSPRIIGVQKPYMERRLYAAFPVYWPEATVTVTSWQQTLEEYLKGVSRWGRTEVDTINIIVGDFQRIDIYAKKGYQIPQKIPYFVIESFEALVSLGYTSQLCIEGV